METNKDQQAKKEGQKRPDVKDIAPKKDPIGGLKSTGGTVSSGAKPNSFE